MKLLNNWLYDKKFELVTIISPPFLSVFFVFLFQGKILEINELPIASWIFFILFIDVSHVYSTLFRTYFHKIEFQENKTLLIITPFVVWILGILLYSIHSMLFWSILAYVAVFHFVRQQYGFIRLYSAKEVHSKYSQIIDSLILYISVLYPIIFWHTHIPRKFNWFINGDFILGLPWFYEEIFLYLYILFGILYCTKEIYHIQKYGYWNLPKNLLLSGTALSWYIGIVHFNNDFIFTITNVVTHGIPYMALIWIFGKKEVKKNTELKIIGQLDYKIFFKKYSIIIFLAILILFSYCEEGLWDAFVWREHLEIFPLFQNFEKISSNSILSVLVPFLTIPQATHYVLDGFIWKLRNDNSYWKTTIFGLK
ncbi:MAG: hypothetical protein KDK90_23040 [Leptospiraceae bacterium]|nr:hypothetical protein [Leptospiraceae bacterium]